MGEYVNDGGRSIRIRSDIHIQRPDGMFADYDVGITTAQGRDQIDWPTDDQVAEAVAYQDNQRIALGQVRSRQHRDWDVGVNDTSSFDALTHPDVKRISTFRRLAWEAGVLPGIRAMHSDKVRHYQRAGVSVTPLILTAGGSISEVFRDTIHNLCFNANPSDGNERSDFRRRLNGRLAIILLRFAHFMAIDQLKFLGRSHGRMDRVGGEWDFGFTV